MKAVVFGSGGHGKVVLDILLESGVDVKGFIDDDVSKHGAVINGKKILGGWDYLMNNKGVKIALGIGNNKIRASVFEKAKELGIEVVNAIHPKAVVSRSVKLARGIVIMPGVVVSTDTAIEDGVCVNTCASVDHDCRLKQFCHIWPGANLAGAVEVGEYSYVGTGASVIQNLKIGNNAMIGSGAAVISNIPDRATAVGVPAKVIKEAK
ncbi:MAG: acetyltransferase [Candidatus Margulisiibacteriota bacterium]